MWYWLSNCNILVSFRIINHLVNKCVSIAGVCLEEMIHEDKKSTETDYLEQVVLEIVSFQYKRNMKTDCMEF